METTTTETQGYDFAGELGIWPSQDRLVILPQPQEEITAGGIIIPDTAKEKPVIGMVVVAGPGYKDVPQEYQPGEYVMHSKYSGTEVDWQGVTYLVMRSTDVIARVDIEKRKPQPEEDRPHVKKGPGEIQAHHTHVEMKIGGLPGISSCPRITHD